MSEREKAQRAAANAKNPTIYASLMQFALDEPRQEVRREVEKHHKRFTGDFAEFVCEQLGQAYVAGVADGFREAGRQEACPSCNGERVVVHAGSMDKDDGYCELRTCSQCSDGRRLGRSDIPVVSEEPPNWMDVHRNFHHDRPAPDSPRMKAIWNAKERWNADCPFCDPGRRDG